MKLSSRFYSLGCSKSAQTRAALPGVRFTPLLALSLLSVPASAATFTVSRFDDTAAVGSAIPGNGLGAAGDLRAAILAANAVGGSGNTIVFSCGAALCTILLNGPLPPITSNLTINGGLLGQVIIDGNGLYRAFFVDTGTVTLAALQIQHARAKGGDGGIGRLGAGGGGAGLGGGLFVNGLTAAAAVTITNCVFGQNAAIGGNGNAVGSASDGDGGGGGGLGGNGGNGALVTSGPATGDLVNGGGGGVLGPGATGSTSTLDGVDGGLGGGGGTDKNGGSSALAGTGGAGYATNTAGANGSGFGGNGGFGGGGGGGVVFGGSGGFGGGGAGGEDNGGNGGSGGGGGGTTGVRGGNGGVLIGALKGGDADISATDSTGASGGGAAAGPDVFVNQGTLTILNSAASGATAAGGAGGGAGGQAGGADATPVFNFGGTVNGSTTTGPIAGAFPGQVTPTVPALPAWGLGLLGSLLAAAALRLLRKQSAV
jgi:hypothetical protein